MDTHNMTTLQQALDDAQAFWGSASGGRTMGKMAGKCVALLGADLQAEALTASHGTSLITALVGADLAPASVRSYYSTFRRMLELSGVLTHTWPKAPKVPRVRSREPIPGEDLDRLLGWLRCHRWDDTADLGAFIRATGLRILVEAQSGTNIEVQPDVGEGYDVLRVIGKGGHERFIPVVDPEVRSMIRDRDRMRALRRTPYRTHLDRWSKGVKALGIKSKLATPHAVRHSYASNALALSGGNLSMVQELLGHSDPATTARYLHTDLSAKARVLAGLQVHPTNQHKDTSE